MFTHLFRILKYGTSYAIATGFFPKETAKKVLLLYSFVRIPDNIVDDVSRKSKVESHNDTWSLKLEAWSLDKHYAQAKTKLLALRDERTHAYTNNLTQDTQRGQYVSLFKYNQIPFQYSLDFYQAMIDDCTIHRYDTYTQLEWYMYGSASVVGLMMCHLIGFVYPKDERIAKQYATKLWNAMQLTNFLRDVREDYEELGRIYIPLDHESIITWSINHDDIISFCHWGYKTASEEQKKVRADTIKVYIAQCRTMYAHSLDGLQYLNPAWRKAVRLAAILYESILDKIEANEYDVFTKSCRTNLWDKCKVLFRNRK